MILYLYAIFPFIYTRGRNDLGAKRLVGWGRLGRKRLEGETTRGGNGWGAKHPGFVLSVTGCFAMYAIVLSVSGWFASCISGILSACTKCGPVNRGLCLLYKNCSMHRLPLRTHVLGMHTKFQKNTLKN